MKVFFPGETVSHIFYIPFAPNEIDYVVASYKQNGAIILEKKITSGFEESQPVTSKFIITLTQNESLLFDDDYPFSIQLNVYTTGGTRHVSHEISSSSGIQYLREVMTDG